MALDKARAPAHLFITMTATPKVVRVPVTVRLPVETWRSARRLVEEEVLRGGGRASISALVTRLVVEAAARRPAA